MPVAGDREGAAVRRQQALELRIAGASYRAIAAQLGVGLVTAHKYVQRELARVEAISIKLAEDLKTLELARLDRFQLALNRKAIGGEERAIVASLRVMERRAKLAGLDAADKVDLVIHERIEGRLKNARKRAAGEPLGGVSG